MCLTGYLFLVVYNSSLIAALAARHRFKRIESGEIEEAWWPRLHSFSVGLENSPDMKYARTVAAHIGTVHHEIVFTVQEGLDALPDVIRHLETFDVTTIRAGTPMYLMARKIKSMGIKMVLSGEGADEVFGGYLYFHMAPSAEEFHEETVRKLFALSKYDCCRANKATAAWGVEARVPFLDKEFLRLRDVDKPCRENVSWLKNREGNIAGSIYRSVAAGDLVASKGAVFRRSGVQLD